MSRGDEGAPTIRFLHEFEFVKMAECENVAEPKRQENKASNNKTNYAMWLRLPFHANTC